MADGNVHNLKSIADFKSTIGGEATAPATTEETASSLVAVDFFATWCPPCKAIAPKWVDLSKKYDGKVRFYKVDVDEVPEAAQEAGVSAMPTFLFFKKGELLETVVGADLKKIENALEKNV